MRWGEESVSGVLGTGAWCSHFAKIVTDIQKCAAASGRCPPAAAQTEKFWLYHRNVAEVNPDMLNLASRRSLRDGGSSSQQETFTASLKLACCWVPIALIS